MIGLPPLVLASGSPWRATMLREAGLSVEVLPPPDREEEVTDPDPRVMAGGRARQKARDVAALRPGALVIGADQVGHLDGLSFGKPRDAADWLDRLRSLRGRTHTLSTGLALEGPGGSHLEVVDAHVTFRADLTDNELLAYIALGEARGCAGGYMVERRGAWLVDKIDGDWMNVIGLPLTPLITALRRRGWRLPA